MWQINVPSNLSLWYQENIASSNLLFLASAFPSSSFTLRYQGLLLWDTKSSMRQINIPSNLSLWYQENIVSSNLLFLASAFSSSSFTLRYQGPGASHQPYTVTKNFRKLIVPTSGGGFKKTFLLIGCPYMNAELVSNEWIFRSKETIIDKIILKFSLQHVSESFLILSFSVSSKPRATFVLFFVVTTHLTDIVLSNWPSFATSWKVL